MPITDADIKLLASERLTDDHDGGGFMTGTVVQDGVENNLFEDISQLDRALGRVRLRKCYVAALNADRDALLGAHALLDGVPDDPATTALLVSAGGAGSTREDVVGVLNASAYRVKVGATKRILGPGVITAGVTTAIQARFGAPHEYSFWNGVENVTATIGGEIAPGSVLGFFTANAASPIPDVSMMAVVHVLAVEPAGGGGFGEYLSNITLERPPARSYGNNTEVDYNPAFADGVESATDPNDYAVLLDQDVSAGAVRFYGQTTLTSARSIGQTSLPVVSTWGQYIPVGEGDYPQVDPALLGVDPAPFAATGGRVAIFRPHEAVVVHDTQTTAPVTVANGQIIDLGRENLSRVRVFGADGLEITSGYSADLPAGTITFASVAGYSQPVTIRHRIEDMILCTLVTEQEIRLARGLAHAYPSGAMVSSALAFGDLQARAHPGFQQQAWTGVWSDERIGSDIVADYNEASSPVVVTNEGAITERWAFIFTSSTTFRVVGEQVGEVVNNGSTAVPTAPTNPATGAPYFTLPSTGWGTGWAAGNVYRRNTTGANAPLWVIRSTAPSDPHEGQDGVLLAIRGSVNA